MTAREQRVPEQRAGQVVVGVDGSACSVTALRWAADLAESTGRGVTVVHAWLPELRPRVEPALEREIAGATADRMVAATIAEAIGDDAARVTTVVRQGDPLHVLVDAARDADLLVVGTRGHGELMGALLGSVAARLAAESPVPVVVVPSGVAAPQTAPAAPADPAGRRPRGGRPA